MFPRAQADSILDAAAIPSVVGEVVRAASSERSPSGAPVRRMDDSPLREEEGGHMKYMLLITPAPMCGSASTGSTRMSRSGPRRVENTIRPCSVTVIVGPVGNQVALHGLFAGFRTSASN